MCYMKLQLIFILNKYTLALTKSQYQSFNYICMIICFELIRHAGYNLNNVGMDELMIATIHAANGVTDYVEKIFRESIRLKETR